MPAAAAIKALIVDDQMTMRSLVRTGLREMGVLDTREAVDGEDGLRQLLTAPANLIISDYNMPKLDGLGLLRAVRSLPQFKTTGFVMLTGRADGDLVQRAIQFGANNYLVKPFTVSTLRQKIEDVYGALS